MLTSILLNYFKFSGVPHPSLHVQNPDPLTLMLPYPIPRGSLSVRLKLSTVPVTPRTRVLRQNREVLLRKYYYYPGTEGYQPYL